ncbi:MAG: cysteine peptidase family C39 domain-containing protein, partial [Candidatus Omnitrophica bacterium]|nr:cysteine peptidase family C39 domain-containing protein [Candidatus Omnitrophota bacterium]
MISWRDKIWVKSVACLIIGIFCFSEFVWTRKLDFTSLVLSNFIFFKNIPQYIYQPSKDKGRDNLWRKVNSIILPEAGAEVYPYYYSSPRGISYSANNWALPPKLRSEQENLNLKKTTDTVSQNQPHFTYNNKVQDNRVSGNISDMVRLIQLVVTIVLSKIIPHIPEDEGIKVKDTADDIDTNDTDIDIEEVDVISVNTQVVSDNVSPNQNANVKDNCIKENITSDDIQKDINNQEKNLISENPLPENPSLNPTDTEVNNPAINSTEINNQLVELIGVLSSILAFNIENVSKNTDKIEINTESNNDGNIELCNTDFDIEDFCNYSFSPSLIQINKEEDIEDIISHILPANYTMGPPNEEDLLFKIWEAVDNLLTYISPSNLTFNCATKVLSQLLPYILSAILAYDLSFFTDERGQTSMLGIKKVAEKYGLFLYGVKLDWKDLENSLKNGDMVIAHLDMGNGLGHYVIVVDITDDTVTYIDNNEKITVSKEEFLKLWTEYSLVTKRPNEDKNLLSEEEMVNIKGAGTAIKYPWAASLGITDEMVEAYYAYHKDTLWLGGSAFFDESKGEYRLPSDFWEVMEKVKSNKELSNDSYNNSKEKELRLLRDINMTKQLLYVIDLTMKLGCQVYKESLIGEIFTELINIINVIIENNFTEPNSNNSVSRIDKFAIDIMRGLVEKEAEAIEIKNSNDLTLPLLERIVINNSIVLKVMGRMLENIYKNVNLPKEVREKANNVYQLKIKPYEEINLLLEKGLKGSQEAIMKLKEIVCDKNNDRGVRRQALCALVKIAEEKKNLQAIEAIKEIGFELTKELLEENNLRVRSYFSYNRKFVNIENLDKVISYMREHKGEKLSENLNHRNINSVLLKGIIIIKMIELAKSMGRRSYIRLDSMFSRCYNIDKRDGKPPKNEKNLTQGEKLIIFDDNQININYNEEVKFIKTQEFSQGHQSQAPPEEIIVNCAANALSTLLNLQGIKVSPTQIAQKLNENGFIDNRGYTSLYGIQEIAKEYGLDLKALEGLNLSQLAKGDIVHLDIGEGHFVTIENIEKDSVSFWDNGRLKTVSCEKFSSLMTGYGLVLNAESNQILGKEKARKINGGEIEPNMDISQLQAQKDSLNRTKAGYQWLLDYWKSELSKATNAQLLQTYIDFINSQIQHYNNLISEVDKQIQAINEEIARLSGSNPVINAPDKLSVKQKETTTVNISVSGFNGNVSVKNLNIAGPEWVKFDEGTLIINPDGSVAPGEYSVTITASDGTSTVTKTISITVNASRVINAPDKLSVKQKETTTVNISVSGFRSDVNISVS